MTISIVTKTFNRLSLVLDCISAVQQLRNEPYEKEIVWEHVIYDDGSTDGTREHFARHTYPGVRYIRGLTKQGIPKSANEAIATCNSEYIFELDSDDIVPQRVLYNVYHTLREYPHAEWIVADFYRTDAKCRYEQGSDYFGWEYKNTKEVLDAIFAGNHFIQHNVFYRKDLWEQAGRYDTTLTMAEDLDLYIRFLLAGKMPIYVPYISHFHRNHEENVSKHVGREEHIQDLKKLYEKYEKDLAALNVKLTARNKG